MIIQPDWENIPSDERVSLADNYFEEDTYVVISDISCPGCEFRTTEANEGALEHLSLDDFDFKATNFNFSNFSNSTFRRAFFGVPDQGRFIQPSTFNAANFSDCIFTNASFISGDQDGENLSLDIDFTNTIFDQSNFVSAEISGCYGINVSFEGCTMINSIVTNNDFRSVRLIGTDIPFSIFTGNDFTNAEMTGADPSYSDISNSIFRRAVMSFTDFTSATANGADFCFVTKIDIEIDSLITDETTLCDSLFRSDN
jgi:hypothetical protein